MWQPHEDALVDILNVMRQDISQFNNEQHAAYYARLEQFEQIPEFNCYMAHVCVNMQEEAQNTRFVCGLKLRGNITRNYLAMEPEHRLFLKQTAVEGLGDGDTAVRNTCGSVLSTIALVENLDGWESVLEGLMGHLQHPNLVVVDGALGCLQKVVEDCIHTLTMSEAMETPLAAMVVAFIQFCHHDEGRIQLKAIQSLGKLLKAAYVPHALYQHIEDYLAALVHLKDNPEAQIQLEVVWALTTLFCTQYSVVEAIMDDILKFMLETTCHDDARIGLAACEFWLATMGHDDFTMDHLEPYLEYVVKVLVRACIYTDVDIALMQGTLGEDADNPDLAEDLAPMFSKITEARMMAQEDEDEEGPHVEPDVNSDQTSWTRRTCAATTVDQLATVYRDHIADLLLAEVDVMLSAEDWFHNEAGVLVLGAIAEGCYDTLRVREGFMALIMEKLCSYMNSEHVLMRVIACWSISRYSNWVMEDEDDSKWFTSVMHCLLNGMADNNKRVQEAAVSAFATFEEAAGTRLRNYMGFIIQNLYSAAEKFQKKNLVILYDAISCLIEAVGDASNDAKLVVQLVPPLMDTLSQYDARDRYVFPLLECLGVIARNIGNSSTEYAPRLWGRALEYMSMVMEDEKNWIASNKDPSVEPPDSEFALCALDLISGLCDGLGGTVDALVQKDLTLVPMVMHFSTYPDPDTRQSALAVLGDLAKCCPNHLAEYQKAFLYDAILANLEPVHAKVCQNAAWALGEFAMGFQEHMQPFVGDVMRAAQKCYASNRDLSDDEVRVGNLTIALGKLCSVCPEEAANSFHLVGRAWLENLAMARETDKDQAFRGLTWVVRMNPMCIVDVFDAFCFAIANYGTDELTDEMRELFRQTLAHIHDTVGPNWDTLCATVDDDVMGYLRQIYGM